MRKSRRLLWLLVLGGAMIGVAARLYQLSLRPSSPQSQTVATRPVEPVEYTYDIVREYPHDPAAFTQGLIYHDGFLYESTGPTGSSTLRKVRLETGEVVQKVALGRRYFGEGLTHWKGGLLQLAPVRDGIKDLSIDRIVDVLRRRGGQNEGFRYDLTTFERRGSFAFQGEGWGLTHDGERLILSDGRPHLRFLDPETFKELGSVNVDHGADPEMLLNELEYIKGEVYANIWYEDLIYIINPDSGAVAGKIDLKDLRTRMAPPPDNTKGAVLNGIAYDVAGDRLFVTGKLWPKLFEIRLHKVVRK